MYPVLDQGQWTATELADFALRGWRSRRPGEFPPCLATVRPFDYGDDFHRGTVEWSEGWKNYSYHRVIVPDLAHVKGCNFSQADPVTPALVPATPGGTITLEDCTLVNVGPLDTAFSVVRCNRSQAWRVDATDATGAPIVDVVYLAVSPLDVTDIMLQSPPLNRIVPFDVATSPASGFATGPESVSPPGIFARFAAWIRWAFWD